MRKLGGLPAGLSTALSTALAAFGTPLRVDAAQSLSSAQKTQGSTNLLGFGTPVQQGGGAGQASNKLFLGWSGSKLKGQVDALDLGSIWTDNDASIVFGGAGYQRLPSGLILQWGSASGSGGNGVWTFPTTFPRGVFSIVGTAAAGGAGIGISTSTVTTSYATYFSTSAASSGNYNGSVQFFAVGY